MITPEIITVKLASIEGLRFKKRFFGTSIYSQAIFFGMLVKGKLYFRVNNETVCEYEAFRMKAFSFKPVSQNLFYEVPEKIINHPTRLIGWAKKAVQISCDF